MVENIQALTPLHEKLSDEEKTEFLNNLAIGQTDLPKIFASDPAIDHLSPKTGDVIKITRESKSAKESHYYRIVIS